MKLRRLGKRLRLLPAGRRRRAPHRLDRLELALGDDGQEAAVAHDCDDAGHALDRGRVERRKRRAVLGGRTTRACTMPASRRSCT